MKWPQNLTDGQLEAGILLSRMGPQTRTDLVSTRAMEAEQKRRAAVCEREDRARVKKAEAARQRR